MYADKRLILIQVVEFCWYNSANIMFVIKKFSRSLKLPNLNDFLTSFSLAGDRPC